MLTAEQYRAKASEYAGLLNGARSPAETRMFRELKQSYLSLAENMEWLAANPGKTIRPGAGGATAKPRGKQGGTRPAPAARDNILRSLGAAVILRWNTIPTKLRRELFEDSSTIGDVQRIVPLKKALARFLHDHKDDAHKAKSSG